MIFQLQNNRDIFLATIFLSLAYAPSPFGYLIYFAFIPVVRISMRMNPKNAFICGYIIGLLSNMILLHWIAIYNPWYYLVFIPINALQIAAFSAIISLLAKRNQILTIVIFPFLWTSIEFVRQLGSIAFTWLNIAYTQTNFLYLIQFAEYTGTSGIILWICLVNMFLILLWDNRRLRPRFILFFSILLFLFFLPLIHGKFVLSSKIQTAGIISAYVQPNIESQRKWAPSFREKNLWILLSESQNLKGYSPDLIVWPETALPYNYKNYPEVHDILRTWVNDNKTAIITGTLDREISRKYNAAILISGENKNTLDFYRKIRPVPFAEKAFWTEEHDTASISSGTDFTLFNFYASDILLSYENNDWIIENKTAHRQEFKCAALICFESAFPSMARKMIEKGADLLIIITNDEAFGYSAQPYQHLQIARMRAIENRRSIIHCANTGISAFIDPFGNVYQYSELFTSWRSVKTLPVWTQTSFYTRFGDWIDWIYIGITFILGLFIITRSKKIQNV